MNGVTRSDTSMLGQWWWTVDRWLLAIICILAFIGGVLMLAASPAVAQGLKFDTYHFVIRQMLFLPLGLLLMILISVFSPHVIRRIALLMILVAVPLMIFTIAFGEEIKGANRWISFGLFSLQPSEFVKPAFAVLAAWLFAQRRINDQFPGYALASILYCIIMVLLILQPDIGMALVVSAIWGVQFFLAGLPFVFVICLGVLFLAGSVFAYFSFDHVQSRVDNFLNPAIGDGYQINRAIEAFKNGGLFGRGPGEGEIKQSLPEAHADFILSVAGEEFGFVICFIIILLYMLVVSRGLGRAFKSDDLFILLSVAGLIVQFSIQAIINMASTLNMMPPKGMTLPFISYGGSSIIAIAITMGMVLSLTRHHVQIEGAIRR